MWKETKRVFARKESDLNSKVGLFATIPWCNRSIYYHQAYSAIFMMKTELKYGGVLLADSMGLGKVNPPLRILLEQS